MVFVLRDCPHDVCLHLCYSSDSGEQESPLLAPELDYCQDPNNRKIKVLIEVGTSEPPFHYQEHYSMETVAE